MILAGIFMTLTESTIEETTLKLLKDMGCQRTAFAETDKRMEADAADIEGGAGGSA